MSADAYRELLKIPEWALDEMFGSRLRDKLNREDQLKRKSL